MATRQDAYNLGGKGTGSKKLLRYDECSTYGVKCSDILSSNRIVKYSLLSKASYYISIRCVPDAFITTEVGCSLSGTIGSTSVKTSINEWKGSYSLGNLTGSTKISLFISGYYRRSIPIGLGDYVIGRATPSYIDEIITGSQDYDIIISK